MCQKQDWEAVCKTLEKINGQYQENSEESAALRFAALALHFIFIEQLGKRFHEFVATFDDPITEEQKRWLQSMGIDPE